MLDITQVAALYVEMLRFALPITVFFGLGNILLNMFTSAFFGGHLRLGGKF